MALVVKVVTKQKEDASAAQAKKKPAIIGISAETS